MGVYWITLSRKSGNPGNAMEMPGVDGRCKTAPTNWLGLAT